MKKRLTLLLAVLSGWSVAQAAETGPYVGIQGGFNWAAPQYLRHQQLDFVRMNFKNPTSGGYVYGAAAGWRFSPGLRSELAVNYRKNTLSSFSKRYYEGGSSSSGQGSEAFFGAFANVWYDMPLSMKITDSVQVVPYIGGGIGYGRLTIKGLAANGVHFGQAHNDDVGAWQLGAGVLTKITDAYSISLNYRYMRTASANYGLIEGLPPQDVITHYQAQSAMVGFYHYF
ncbi:outer membrane beta-barrel protein [Serratia fonticola]|uniref:outer membrane protein n=1 Tax=Serratia fonticola TaxID=47917 RepID=UPI003AB0A329